MDINEPIKVGITVGDINGIGVEVILKTLQDNRIYNDITPVIYGSSKVISYHKKALDYKDIPYQKIKDNTILEPKHLYIKNCWEEDVKINLGEETLDGGKYAIEALKQATEDLASNKIDVLVTSPINKNNVQGNDFNFPGHTEYLAKFANVDDVLMLMVADRIKVAVVTGHIPLKEVSKHLTKDKIKKALKLLSNSLKRDFAISNAKIAVLGLNPHAGEKGLLGKEENETISPAINEAKKDGILAFGPFSADGFFGSGNYIKYDAVLAMYHDQGLIPFKCLSFGEGVNYTAGLPIVRTSPDHGTAYNLVGKNEASENSFRNAIYTAVDIFKTRRIEKEISANPLQRQKI